MNLDDVVPCPQFRIYHSRVIAAPLADIWDELNTVPMSALPFGLALESLRLLPAKLSGKKHPGLAERTFLEITPIPVLFSEPPHLVISAGLSQGWRLLGGSTPPVLDAAGLRDWTGTGWLKIGMEFRLEATSKGNNTLSRFWRWQSILDHFILSLLLLGYKETVSEMPYFLRSSCARNQRSTRVHSASRSSW